MSQVKFQTAQGKPDIQLYGGNLEAFKSKDRFVILVGGGGTGKMEWIENSVPTPQGWRRFGDLEVGDEVFSEKGLPTTILEIHPQGEKQLYKVNFNDGSSVEVGADHLWTVWTEKQRDTYLLKDKKGRTGNPKVLTTLNIKENIHKRFTIPITEPVQYSKKELLIDPYIMGIIIGDGHIGKKSVNISSSDDFIINKVRERLINGYSLTQAKSRKYDYAIVSNENNNQYIRYFKSSEKILSNSKYIPREYLISSIEDRIELLQGLMDSDGFIDKRGTVSYSTVSQKLSTDFKELVESLGGICKIKTKTPIYIYKGEKKEGQLCYTIHVNLPNGIQGCSLPRKVERLNSNRKYLPMRKIISIELSEVKEAMCIAVDNPSELYLTKDYIVTHNTWAMTLKLHLYCVMYPGVRVLLCRKSLPALRNSVVKTYQTVLEKTGYKDRVRVLGETRPTEFHYQYDEREHNGVVYKGESKILLSQIDLQGKILGAEFDMIYVNQPDTEGLTEDEFTLVASRARLNNAPYQQILADPNPASENHWLRLGSFPDQEGKVKWRLYHSVHQDNPLLYDHETNEWTKAGKIHLEGLELLPDYMKQSQLRGEWFSTAGTVFGSSFSFDKHVISFNSEKALSLGISRRIEGAGDEPDLYVNAVPQDWEHYLTIDWGRTEPFTAILVVKHPAHDLYIAHKHIYITEKDILEVSEMVKEMIAGYNIKAVIADKDRNMSTVMERVTGYDITPAKKGNNSVTDTVNVMIAELNSDRWLFVNSKESLFHEPDHLLLEKKKLMGVEELANLKRDEHGGIAKKQQDHYADALRYLIKYLVDLQSRPSYPQLLWL